MRSEWPGSGPLSHGPTEEYAKRAGLDSIDVAIRWVARREGMLAVGSLPQSNCGQLPRDDGIIETLTLE